MSSISGSGSGGGGGVGNVKFLNGNSGGNVGPDLSGVVNVVGSGSISVAGNPGTNTLTISSSGGGITINGDSGSATGTTLSLLAQPQCGQSVLFSASSSTISLNVTDGSNNTYLGLNAGGSTPGVGADNTVVGKDALGLLGNSCRYNCIFGVNAGSAYDFTESSNIIIGYNNTGVNNESNTLRIGTSTGFANPGQLNRAFIAGIAGRSVANTNIVTIDDVTNQLGSYQQVVFSAYLSADVTNVTGAGAVYVIPFDTITSNIGLYYSTGPSQFTPGLSGVYFFTLTVLLSSVSVPSANIFNLLLRRNGTTDYTGSFSNPTTIAAAGDFYQLSANIILPLNGGDIIQPILTVSGGTGNDIGIIGGQNWTNFGGFRVA